MPPDALAAALGRPLGGDGIGPSGRPALRRGARPQRPAAIAAAVRAHPLLCRNAAGGVDLVERRLAGARWRHTLTRAEVRHGVLLAEPDLGSLLQWWQRRPGGSAHVALVTAPPAGRTVVGQLEQADGPRPAFPGRSRAAATRPYGILLGIGPWLADQGAAPGDDVVFIPEAPDARRFRITLSRAAEAPAGLPAADAALADEAAAVLRASRGRLHALQLLRRLVGRCDLGREPGVHLPVFVLGRDPRFVVDGPFYALRRGEPRGSARPAPRGPAVSAAFPADWPRADPVREMADSLLGEVAPSERAMVETLVLRALREAISSDVRRQFAQARRIVWQVVRDRARLLVGAPPLAVLPGGGGSRRGRPGATLDG